MIAPLLQTFNIHFVAYFHNHSCISHTCVPTWACYQATKDFDSTADYRVQNYSETHPQSIELNHSKCNIVNCEIYGKKTCSC